MTIFKAMTSEINTVPFIINKKTVVEIIDDDIFHIIYKEETVIEADDFELNVSQYLEWSNGV